MSKSIERRIYFVFVLTGAVSGFSTIGLFLLLDGVPLPTGSVTNPLAALALLFLIAAIFPVGLNVSLELCQRRQWLCLFAGQESRPMMNVALLSLLPSYLFGFIVVGFLFVAPLYYFAPRILNEWSAVLVDPTVGDLNILVWLTVASPVPALLMAYALRILTGNWDREGSRLLLIASAATGILGYLFSRLVNPPDLGDWVAFCFPVGNILFGAATAFWLIRNQANPLQKAAV